MRRGGTCMNVLGLSALTGAGWLYDSCVLQVLSGLLIDRICVCWKQCFLLTDLCHNDNDST